jgi:hypothetical protein
MSRETYSTIDRYGKKVYVGRRICINCWRLKASEVKDSDDSKSDC